MTAARALIIRRVELEDPGSRPGEIYIVALLIGGDDTRDLSEAVGDVPGGVGVGDNIGTLLEGVIYEAVVGGWRE